MAKTKRGARTGTGPYKDSYVRRKGSTVGRRQKAGQPCPKK